MRSTEAGTTWKNAHGEDVMQMTKEEWEKDWRNNGQENYLLGVSLSYRKYVAPSKTWLHDHCVFCWATISEDGKNDLHEGYTTSDLYYWICDDCYNDLKDIFGWKVVSR